MSRGPLGKYTLELGDFDSIFTNTTDYYTKLTWEGIWGFSYYKAVENGNCCTPLQPIILTQDRITNTISGNVYYPKNQTCPPERLGKVQSFNISIDGRIYDDDGTTRAFYLPNDTILVEDEGCVIIYNRLDIANIDMVPDKMGAFLDWFGK